MLCEESVHRLIGVQFVMAGDAATFDSYLAFEETDRSLQTVKYQLIRRRSMKSEELTKIVRALYLDQTCIQRINDP